mgnify:CR=1 FL=1
MRGSKYDSDYVLAVQIAEQEKWIELKPMLIEMEDDELMELSD